MNWQITEDYWENENTLRDVIMDMCDYVKVKALVAQSCLPLCDPMDCSPSGSMGFPRQEYWSRLLFPPAGYLPDPGIEPESPVSPALAGRFFTTVPPGKPSHLAISPKKSRTALFSV